MIDLHVHSTYSDGSLTPAQLVDEAVRVGLSALALTDHDSTDGVAEFLAACRGQPVEGIAGVELSAEIRKGTMHVLGYCVDPDSSALQEALSTMCGGREVRNRRILQRLNALGLELTWDEVSAFAGNEVVGRPHFALAMMARGYVQSKDCAFDRYLAKGKPGYVDRLRLSPEACVQKVREAGGVAVLAHPFTLELNPDELRDCVAQLANTGLGGIEVYYPEHPPRMTARYKRLADDFGLVATGGSDYHGELNPLIRLGVGFGTLAVPDEAVAELRRRRERDALRPCPPVCGCLAGGEIRQKRS